MNEIVEFFKKIKIKNAKVLCALVVLVTVLFAATLMLLIDCGTLDTKDTTVIPAAYKTTLLMTDDEATQIDTLVDFSNINTLPDGDENPGMLEPADNIVEDDIEEEDDSLPEALPVVTYDYEDIDETIPYETVYKKDTTMKKGQTRVVAGTNGIKTKVYHITFTDGVETARELVAVKVKKEAVNKIVYEGTIDTQEASRGETFAYSKVLECKATAYTNDAIWGDHIAFSYLCGGGLRTRWGIIATDPSVIPAGTKVYVKSARADIKDYGYAIAADTGSAIKGYIIDLWMDDGALCSSFGVKPVEVYVLEDQSVDVFALRGDYEWSR